MTSRKAQRSLVVKRDLLRCGLLAFMGVCLTVAGALALFAPLQVEDALSTRIWMGGFGTAIGIGITAWSIYRLRVQPYLLSIDEHGIVDNSNWMSPGLIEWDQVRDAYILELGHNSYLCVDLEDPHGFLKSLPRRRQKLMEANLQSGFAPVRIQLAAMPGGYTCKDALDVVHTLHPGLVRGKKKIKAPKLA